MTHGETHDSPGTEVAEAFTDAEWQELRAEDFRGATAVVCIMVGIFTIGVILYTIVAISATS